jgi:hypothetical protein
MIITKTTKTIRLTKPCGCSISLSIHQLFIDGILQSSPENVKELSYA